MIETDKIIMDDPNQDDVCSEELRAANRWWFQVEQHIEVLGKTIVGCCKTQDNNGYDVLHISFSDGSGLLVREEGQAGHFSVQVLKPNIG